MFTLENTKDATHVDIIRGCFEFLNQDSKKYLSRISGKWTHDATGVVEIGKIIELSRPHNEIREYWTKDGITKYAQGNEMDITKLVPIDFSRKITPPVIGDKIYNSQTDTTFIIDGEDSQVENLKYKHKSFDTSHFYVICYADRPNTGKQPVGDDVVVDCVYGSESGTDVVSEFFWGDDGDKSTSDLTTWKTNHAYMVKAYQESLSNKLTGTLGGEGGTGVLEWPSSGHQENIHPGVEQAHHVALQTEALGDNPTLDLVVNPDVKSFDEISDNIEAAIERSKPVFTQAQSDAGELPMVGSEFMCSLGHVDDYTRSYAVGLDGSGQWLVIQDSYDNLFMHNIENGVYKFKPLKSDAKNLFDEMIDTLTNTYREHLTDKSVKEIEIDVNALLESDKFTITLNKG